MATPVGAKLLDFSQVREILVLSDPSPPTPHTSPTPPSFRQRARLCRGRRAQLAARLRGNRVAAHLSPRGVLQHPV